MQSHIDKLVENAKLYKIADRNLEIACGENYDPIACTVYARKGIHLNSIPNESHDAAFYLGEVTRLHAILVKTYFMDTDEVRTLWFPILNS